MYVHFSLKVGLSNEGYFKSSLSYNILELSCLTFYVTLVLDPGQG